MPVSDQGPLSGRYTIIPRTLIFLTRGEKLLLLKGAPHKRLWANRYNGIGGHIERGEDVLSAARRELLEETGLDASDLRLCGTVLIDTGSQVGILLFVLRGEGGTLTDQALIDSEEGSLEWVPIQNVFNLPLVEDLPVLLPRILSMRPGDPPFSANSSYGPDEKLQVRFG